MGIDCWFTRLRPIVIVSESILIYPVYKFFDLVSHLCLFNLRTCLDLFFVVLFYYKVILGSNKSYQNSTKNSHLPFIQIPQILIFCHISTNIFSLSLFLSLHTDIYTDPGICSFLFFWITCICKPDTLKLALKLDLHHCIVFVPYLRKVSQWPQFNLQSAKLEK